MLMNLETIGRLAYALQTPVSAIQRTAEAIGVKPSLVIDGIPHFSETDCLRIAKALNARQRPRRGHQVHGAPLGDSTAGFMA